MPLIRKAYRYTLEPDRAQRVALESWAPALRFLWNWMLAQRRYTYTASEGRVRVSYADQCAQLPAMKLLFPWLAELPSQVLQQTLRDLDRAFQNFFEKRAGYPAFKSKKNGNPGLRWPQGIEANGQAVYLPKLGWVRTRVSRKPQGTLKSATVRFDGLRWKIALLYEIEHQTPAKSHGHPIGIDLGTEESLAVSDARLIHLPVVTPEETRQARRLARRVSRCVPDSRRHAKAKLRLLTFKRRIQNRVHDSRHKLTTQLAKNHGLICVEDLAVKNMTRSAKGTIDAPGKNVAAKSGLNRVLLQEGPAETRRQLEYKATWLGNEVRPVNPAYTSQTCPHCGHIAAKNRPSRAVFRCTQCGHTGHADIIAAQNILSAGLAATVRGAPQGAMKRELPLRLSA